MADRAMFVGFGQPVRGREERAVEVFNEFVGLCGRMQADGRIEDMDVTLLDPHGGDLGGFFMLHGSAEQCSALPRSEEHTSELQSRLHLVCRLLLEKKKKNKIHY